MDVLFCMGVFCEWKAGSMTFDEAVKFAFNGTNWILLVNVHCCLTKFAMKNYSDSIEDL